MTLFWSGLMNLVNNQNIEHTNLVSGQQLVVILFSLSTRIWEVFNMVAYNAGNNNNVMCMCYLYLFSCCW